MKNATLLCMMVTAAAVFGPGDAEAIFKCTTAKGVVYQDRPCREGTETDLQIVVPTGEMAPKSQAMKDDGSPDNGARVESRFGAPKGGRASGEDGNGATRPADRRGNDATANASNRSSATNTAGAATNTANSASGANAADDRGRKDGRSASGSTSASDSPGNTMTAEQAAKTEPTAKYYTTDAVAPGAETPQHMTCESPSGEKRRFILTNGKLSSI